MAPPPSEVVQWLKQTYPRPSVDPEWLEGCYTWIEDELKLSPARDMPAILDNVNTQLLESDFADSMLAGTGIPQDALGAVHTVIRGPVLVEVVGMTDIGHSASTLLQVYESRAEYKKQAELRRANGDEEQQKPMPKFPRSMLQFQLSDGVSVLPAIETKTLSQFELGETPLGFKMIIKNVTVRRGTAFLEPKCVELKGHRTADRDEQRDVIFLRALKQRMGEDVPEDDPPAESQPEPAPRAPAPAPASAVVAAPPPPPPASRDATAASGSATPPRLPQLHPKSPTRSPRPPLAGIAIPPEPKAGPSNAISLNINEHADDADGPRRRKLPSRAHRSPSPDPPPRGKDKEREGLLGRSRYFAQPSDTDKEGMRAVSSETASSNGHVTLRGPGTDSAMKEFARSIGLSPQRGPPVEVPDSDEEELYAPGRTTATAKAKANSLQQKNKQREQAHDLREPSSDGFESEFVMDETFFEAISRAEEEALKRDGTKTSAPPATTTSSTLTQAQSQTQVPTQTRVKAEVLSQATSATLYSTATATSARGASVTRDRGPAATMSSSGPASRGTSVSGTSSSQSKARFTVPDADVITISDEEDGTGKENIPIPTRHVRRRVARWAGEDVIELSD